MKWNRDAFKKSGTRLPSFMEVDSDDSNKLSGADDEDDDVRATGRGGEKHREMMWEEVSKIETGSQTAVPPKQSSWIASVTRAPLGRGGAHEWVLDAFLRAREDPEGETQSSRRTGMKFCEDWAGEPQPPGGA